VLLLARALSILHQCYSNADNIKPIKEDIVMKKVAGQVGNEAKRPAVAYNKSVYNPFSDIMLYDI
jgi:hypothetical protein